MQMEKIDPLSVQRTVAHCISDIVTEETGLAEGRHSGGARRGECRMDRSTLPYHNLMLHCDSYLTVDILSKFGYYRR